MSYVSPMSSVSPVSSVCVVDLQSLCFCSFQDMMFNETNREHRLTS